MTKDEIEAMKQWLEALEKSQSALAEELSAWDIDPPLHHVQESHDLCGPAITSLRQAIAELESQERNFCSRCGKRTNDIHTCTPPQRSESSGKPSAWVGMTEQEVWDAVRDTVGIMPSKAFRVYQAIEAKLKEKNNA